MHGRKPHKVRGACTVKGSAFTTWDAAQAAVVTTPDAVRPYRGDCCGYYHITRYTVDEYAQRMAEMAGPRRVQESWLDDTVDPKSVQTEEETDVRGEPQADAGDAGPEAVQRVRIPRFTPSPATLAKRLAPRRSAQES